MGYFNYNGKLFENNQPVIGPDNRGLRFGDGVFETFCMSKGRLELANEHFFRLWKGMGILGFEVPVHFSPEKLTSEILHLAQKNGHSNHARIRLTIVRGNGGLLDPQNHTPNYLIQSWELPETAGTMNSNGLVLGLFTEIRKQVDILSSIKHNNYLPGVIAALHAKKEKWNDAILLNTTGRVCETTIANIFMVKAGRFITPPVSEGCIAGVMRLAIIDALRKAGKEIIEASILPEELLEADEVFVTNSIYRLRWVHRIGEKEYGCQQTLGIYKLVDEMIASRQ